MSNLKNKENNDPNNYLTIYTKESIIRRFRLLHTRWKENQLSQKIDYVTQNHFLIHMLDKIEHELTIDKLQTDKTPINNDNEDMHNL